MSRLKWSRFGALAARGPLVVEEDGMFELGDVVNHRHASFASLGKGMPDVLRPFPGPFNRHFMARDEAALGLVWLRKVAAEAGWHTIKISEGACVADAPAPARQLLSRFFPEVSASEGARLPIALTGWLTRSRYWGLERLATDLGRQYTTTRLGMRLTVHFLADGAGQDTGSLMLRAERFDLNADNLVAAPAKVLLTQREREVLALVAAGKINCDIALLLSISARTVQKHLERVFDKLGVETRTAAAMVAVRCIDAPSCRGEG